MVGFASILGGFFSVVGSAGVPPIVTAFSGANVYSDQPIDLTAGSVQLPFTTENFDVGNYFNIAAPTLLTAPVNGVYWIGVSLQFDTAGDVNIALLVDGGLFFSIANKPGILADTTIQTSALMQLTAGQAIAVLASNSGGGFIHSQGVDNGEGNPNFLIALLGTT